MASGSSPWGLSRKNRSAVSVRSSGLATGEEAPLNRFTHEDIEEVRRHCVFTTHTPVPAGHDRFPTELINRVLGRTETEAMREVLLWDDYLNMTYLALNLSYYANGVAGHPAMRRRSTTSWSG